MGVRTLRSCRPNGHHLSLAMEIYDGEATYYVAGPGDERDEDGVEFASEVEAVAFYDAEASR